MTRAKQLKLLFLLPFGCSLFFFYHTYGNDISTRFFYTDPYAISREDKPLSVFVVTQCRSGSSFVGEMFNRQPNVTYFYEPLYPFRSKDCGPAAVELHAASVAAVENITRCQLHALAPSYQVAFETTKQGDEAMCVNNKICFQGAEKCNLFMSRDHPDVFIPRSRHIDINKLSRYCTKTDFRAAKLNYLPSISSIAHLLAAPDVNVKIIHLVRDPRATVSSRLKSDRSVRNIAYFNATSREICSRILANVQFSNKHLRHLTHKFMTIRHEDMALGPVKTVTKVYDFIRRTPSQTLLRWLRIATSGGGNGSESEGQQETDRHRSSEYGTVRRSTTVVNAWRHRLSLEEVEVTQRNCAQVMALLGYKPFEGSELIDLNIPSFA